MDTDKKSESTEPHEWQVGDLGEYDYEGEVLRALRLSSTPAVWVNENGAVGILRNTLEHSVKFLDNTGLQYNYSSNWLADEDFKNGLFDQYFDIHE